MSKGLSKDAEQQVLAAISDICEDVSGGMTPTAALRKVAAATDFPPDMIRLVAIGYNTGAVNHQRESSKTALAKFASLPVADADKVIAELYQQPTAEVKEAGVSDVYNRPPARTKVASAIGTLNLNGDGLTKQAADELFRRALPDKVGYRGEQNRAKLATDKARQRKRALEEIRLQISQAQHQMEQHLHRFSSELQKRAFFYRSNSKLGEVRFLARELHGEPGELAFKQACDAARLKELPAAVPNREPAASYPLLDSLRRGLQKGAEVVDLQRAHDAKAAEFLMECTDDVVAVLHQAKQASAQSVLGRADRAAAAAHAAECRKTASGLVGMLIASNAAKNLMGDALKPPETASLVNRYTEDLSDPNHENEVRAIQGSSMLQDFLNNDEVLSGHPPEQVMKGFNELSLLSPRAATQPAVMRPLLRKYLAAGGLETFETREMADIEKTLAQTKSPHGGGFDAKRTGPLG